MKAMYSVSTNEYFLKNPQLGNIPTRSTIAAWSSLLMLLNANPPCLLRGQSKYFGKCQDAVECHAYMPMARHSAICYIPHTNVYPCIPMHTNVYSVISRIPHNYWPQCQQGHCLHPLLVWQWLIQKGCVFMQMCIVHLRRFEKDFICTSLNAGCNNSDLGANNSSSVYFQ